MKSFEPRMKLLHLSTEVTNWLMLVKWVRHLRVWRTFWESLTKLRYHCRSLVHQVGLVLHLILEGKYESWDVCLGLRGWWSRLGIGYWAPPCSGFMMDLGWFGGPSVLCWFRRVMWLLNDQLRFLWLDCYWYSAIRGWVMPESLSVIRFLSIAQFGSVL